METIPAKTIISAYAADNQWFGTHYNMNLYKGCCHGCIYCDARSDCYQIENFDTVRAKENALQLVEKELRSKQKKGVIGTGAMSDPYNPFEKKYELTRGALERINRYGFGVGIATKSDLIRRDIDLLKQIKDHSPVLVKLTITTFDDELCQKIEPHTCPSSKRFAALKELSENGIFAGILLMPILPFINDTEENILQIVRKAKEVGAKFIFAYGMGVTLRSNQRSYFYEALEEKFPEQDLVSKYIQNFGGRYECSSPQAKHLWRVFERECKAQQILYKMEDIIEAYQRGYRQEQLTLF